MTFNYRAFRTRYEYQSGENTWTEDHYTIREIYYDEEKNIVGCTGSDVGISPGGETLAELQQDIQLMLRDSTWPTLTPRDIPGYEYERNEVPIPEDEL